MLVALTSNSPPVSIVDVGFAADGSVTSPPTQLLSPTRSAAAAAARPSCRPDDNVVITHRWARWVPWSVVSGGLAVMGIGGLVELAASADKQSYETEIERTCAAGCGGDELSHLRDMESRARLEDRIALAVVGAGAATLIAGGVLLFLNRGRPVYEVPRVGVSPTAGGVVTLHAGV